ncbi:MAG: TIM44-like domain-containing protein [Myxococcota bacterium]|nr:TIM44-like domain-containing protein [Myxococcota bacterium]
MRSLVLILALSAAPAEARVGGGQNYGGGGSHSSSSYSGGGSSSSSDGDLVGLLLWLCIEHPAVGIPLTIAVVGFTLYQKSRGGGGHGPTRTIQRGPRRVGPDTQGMAALRQRDPGFSEPLFLDLVQLLFTRVHELRSTGDYSSIDALLTPQAKAQLEKRQPVPTQDVIVGAARILSVSLREPTAWIVVEFEANVTVQDKPIWIQERWSFTRRADAFSPPPDRMQALRCPACGAALETDPQGRCTHCGTGINDGRLQWQLMDLQMVGQRPATAPSLSLGAGMEVGTDLPTVVDPKLQAELRALQARHPELDYQKFLDRVRKVFHSLQEAWSELRWERARPYQTDALFQTHRYWIENYRRAGYRNHLADISIRKIEPVKVGVDAYYEAITLRIFASMRDWTTDAQGRVIGGSDTQLRHFSEYWTFVRMAGGDASASADTEHCPSCGAPLDRVDLGGACGYCGTRIVGAEHAWVLSSITQDEAYRG